MLQSYTVFLTNCRLYYEPMHWKFLMVQRTGWDYGNTLESPDYEYINYHWNLSFVQFQSTPIQGKKSKAPIAILLHIYS